MTFSIAAHDAETGAFGVAVTTKFFGVGSLCPFVEAGVGAVATQAFVNPTFGPRGLRLLAEGRSPQEVVDTLLAGDDGREHRQLHIVDRQGRAAAWTGKETVDWAGHSPRRDFSVAGNMLVGEPTIAKMAEAYEVNRGIEFAERLLRALEAGQAAGGDKRGRQSAAMKIVTSEEYPHLDIRVDDHPDPVVELRRLFEESKREYLPFKQFLPTRSRPAGIYDRTLIDRIIKEQAEHDRTRKSGA
jgi:uncharacterized Ntn-hydrolase superfamily protein